jgi:hypothetical protein
VSRTQRIEELLEEVDALEARFKGWQDETQTPPTTSEMKSGARAYQQWFARALNLVPDDKKDEFRDMYEGGAFITRIRAFLEDPLAANELYDAKCRVPGLMEALIPRKDESHGGTEEVPRGASGAGDPDGGRSAA